MKQFLLLMICSMLMIFSFAQTTFKKNDIYLEAGGNGLFASVNYERQLTKQPGLGVRLGVGFYTENAFYLTLPVGINYLFELKTNKSFKSFIDAGLGVTWTYINGKIFNQYAKDLTNFIPSIGYRRHTQKDLMWRISVTPVINDETFVPWLGFSIGKRF